MAVLVGSELTCRLGLVTPVRLHTLGFHPTAVFGVFGGVYALAKLRGHGADTIADAIGAAGSLSAGLNASFEDGSSTKMMHVGMAATGAMRARGAGRGRHLGAAQRLRRPLRLVPQPCPGARRLALQGDLESIGERWEVLEIASKVHPCAFTMIPHIACALELRKRHGVRPEEIAQVTCRIGRRSFATVCEPVADKRRPATTWHGRISLQHTVAEALVRGRMDKHAYAEANLRDPVINALADRVVHEDDPATTTTRSGGSVTLHLHDGRELTHCIQDMRGTRTNPMTRDDVVAKVLANLQGVLSASRAEQAVEMLLALDRCDDVAAMLDGLAA